MCSGFRVLGLSCFEEVGQPHLGQAEGWAPDGLFWAPDGLFWAPDGLFWAPDGLLASTGNSQTLNAPRKAVFPKAPCCYA